MKLKLNLLSLVMITALGALFVLNSCGDDEAPLTFQSNAQAFCAANPTDLQCFEFDAVAFCEVLPTDSRCCAPNINDAGTDCYCSTGDNATTDTENCCLFEFNPTCFCEANPGDAPCAQPFGLESAIPQDFETQTTGEVDADLAGGPHFRMDDASVTFNGDANISAIEGNGYITMTHSPLSAAPWDYADFKIGTEDDQEEIDLSGFTDPYFNIWVNTGANADSAAFDISFSPIGEQEYDAGGLWQKVRTDGEWRLYSLRLNDVTWSYWADRDNVRGSLSELKPAGKK